MKTQQPAALKVGELAKQTGLSVRTLHYYDEIDLLSPSRRNEAGHRLYTAGDVVRLRQRRFGELWTVLISRRAG
jgi:DNA-binding transcriptional MerR regulator